MLAPCKVNNHGFYLSMVLLDVLKLPLNIALACNPFSELLAVDLKCLLSSIIQPMRLVTEPSLQQIFFANIFHIHISFLLGTGLGLQCVLTDPTSSMPQLQHTSTAFFHGTIKSETTKNINAIHTMLIATICSIENHYASSPPQSIDHPISQKIS